MDEVGGTLEKLEFECILQMKMIKKLKKDINICE
jgi:hypothetical protein